MPRLKPLTKLNKHPLGALTLSGRAPSRLGLCPSCAAHAHAHADVHGAPDHRLVQRRNLQDSRRRRVRDRRLDAKYLQQPSASAHLPVIIAVDTVRASSGAAGYIYSLPSSSPQTTRNMSLTSPSWPCLVYRAEDGVRRQGKTPADQPQKEVTLAPRRACLPCMSEPLEALTASSGSTSVDQIDASTTSTSHQTAVEQASTTGPQG